jgi:hypothetical protein
LQRYTAAMRNIVAPGLAVFLLACSSAPKPAERAPVPVQWPKAADESRRFPSADLVETRVIERELGGKAFMPGGTLATYRKGKSEYQMFAGKARSPTDAAIALSDWRKALANAKLNAAFGGYFGQDGDTPVFVFTKGEWIAGVRGLSEKQADVPARTLAARLN